MELLAYFIFRCVCFVPVPLGFFVLFFFCFLLFLEDNTRIMKMPVDLHFLNVTLHIR